MKVKTLQALSAACFAAGNVSILASAALYGFARVKRDEKLQNDGLFVGLWAPSFFILADRLATAALDRTEQQRFGEADARYTLHEELDVEPVVQSPRPLSHVPR